MIDAFDTLTLSLPPEPTEELLAKLRILGTNPPNLHVLAAKLLTLRSYALSAKPGLDDQARRGLAVVTDQTLLLMIMIAAKNSAEIILKSQLAERPTALTPEHRALGVMVMAAICDDVESIGDGHITLSVRHATSELDS
jgi:hypothetical protein